MNKHHTHTPTILEAIEDPAIFAPHFKDPFSWRHWRGFLSALFGLEPDMFGTRAYHKCTGRTQFPTTQAKEAWLVCGRRSGKSFILALCAVYLACFINWREFLGTGERAVVLVTAADRKQASVILRYIKALLNQTPLLARLVTKERSDEISLSNRVSLEIVTSSYRTSRGRAVCAALLDELAFWQTDENSSEVDSDIVAAIRPSMAQFGDQAILLAASSPYARKGELFNAHKKHYGKNNDPILVWQAATSVMNPTISDAVISEAFARDPQSASAEFGAEFRSDIESYIAREVVEAAIAAGIFERRAQAGYRYVAFVDPSGGSNDSYTLAVAHREETQLVLDCLREVRPAFSPETVTLEFAQVCKSYAISRVVGDRYAGEWPREQFRKRGVVYEPSTRVKSDLYRDLLPLLNSRRVSLLDYPRLINQLVSLERHVARSGRDSIDHPPSSHDDIANAVAGAIVNANSANRQRLRMGVYGYGGGLVTEIDPMTLRPLEPEPRNPGIVMRIVDEHDNLKRERRIR